jgi:hypothetical protein
MAELNPRRVDAALRSLLADIDYDLHKAYEYGEEDGLDHYGELVELFIAAY